MSSKRIPVSRISKPLSSVSASVSARTPNTSFTSDISSISSIKSAATTNTARSDSNPTKSTPLNVKSEKQTMENFNDETSLANNNDTASLGSLSMSRSASINTRSTSTAKTHSYKNTSSTSKNNDTNSSDITKPGDLIKKIEDLVARNKTLEEENSVLRNLIHEESGKKSFDERRILMLKCQIYQLEKQINILAKNLAFRKNAHTESLNTISVLTDSFRSILQNNESRNLVSSDLLTINKNELTRWLEIAESTRIKLVKSEDNEEDKENLSEPSLISSVYTKNERVDMLDICSGNLSHINLRQVSVLETNLSQLFKKLTKLRESMRTIQTEKGSNKKAANVKKNSESMPLHKENLKAQLDDCLGATGESCKQLFDMSLIIPSAPWPVLKISPIEKFTQEMFISKLKSLNLAKLKYQPVEILFKSFFIACNYHCHMKNLELSALNEELKFYRQCHSIQKEYIESVMTLFRTKYEEFISELREGLSSPLRALIEKFWLMKNESTEENLKDFLGYFKLNAKKFDLILEGIEKLPVDNENGQDLIGQTFQTLVNQLDEQIVSLNKICSSNLEKFNFNRIDLNELSAQSDSLLTEILSQTPSSPLASNFDLN